MQKMDHQSSYLFTEVTLLKSQTFPGIRTSHGRWPQLQRTISFKCGPQVRQSTAMSQTLTRFQTVNWSEGYEIARNRRKQCMQSIDDSFTFESCVDCRSSPELYIVPHNFACFFCLPRIMN
mmetsp:Transcript_9547/g.35391  ORF Transcript_9547/g.35391 Transcript_9547/m.35391 type:complete len:121 (+) Transcript_9547:960-1322(+)